METEAQATLERRFFGGHEVLFADVSQAWADHVDFVERLASLADAMASSGGPKARPRRSHAPAVSGSLTARVDQLVARLADDARVRAYEILGDRPKAVEIMQRRLLAG